MDAPDNAGQRQGGQFKPGHSGNPKGMPRGTRHRATQLAEQLMAGDAKEVVQSVVDAAKSGDMTAARLILDRICPPSRGRRIPIDIPPLHSATDLVKALVAVAGAMSRGDISAEEAAAAAAVLEHQRRAVETLDLERRIEALEARK
jgi:hypothetical protein